jgi:lipopolysaccharide export system permease protein
MKKLDWYILKKFVSAFVFVVMLLVPMIILIDYTEKYGDFYKRKAPTASIIWDYYANYMPFLANLLSPITVFIATVFVTAQMTTRTEIIAMLSSGMSFRRFMRPYVIGAAGIGVVIFGLAGWVIPVSNRTRIEFEKKYLKDQFYFSDRNVHIKISPDTYAYLESYNNTIDVGYRFTIEKITGTQLHTKLEAQSISWQKDKQKWLLQNCRFHRFEGMQEEIWQKPSIDTTLAIVPDDFQSKYNEEQRFTLTELGNKINELEIRGADNIVTYQIEAYLRFTAPFAIVILTCMGVIVSARKSRGGVGIQIAIGFVLAFIYIIFFMLSKGVAEKGGISPLLAVWIPNLTFSLVALVMYYTVPR